MKKGEAKILTDREQARDLLPIFYGSKDNVLHGFKEILSNAIDEICNNFDNGEITIKLFDDNKTISIEDTGRGIRLADKHESGKYMYDVFFLTLFAGTKYDKDKDAVNIGCNGVGACTLNYTSEYFKAESWYDGKYYSIAFNNGGEIAEPLKLNGKSDKHGTKITFKLDQTAYTKPTIYEANTLIDIISKISGCTNNIKFKFIYKNETKEFYYETIKDYYGNNISENGFYLKQKTYDINNEVSKVQLVFGTDSNPKQYAMLNKNYLIEGGFINDGFIEGFRNVVAKYVKDEELLNKREKNIGVGDVKDTLSFYIDFESSNVEFVGQTKFSTKKQLYKDVVKQYLQETLEVFMIEQKDEFRDIVDKILLTKRANEKAEATKKEVKKKLQEKTNITNKIEGFYESKSKDLDKRILCICEGKSALASLLSGRRDVHAIFPLRGKILNCLKKSPDSIFKNEVITKLIKVLGCGIEFKSKANKEFSMFNKDKLRYSKVYIIVDQDIDGIGSIFPLVLTVFYVLLPSLIEDGRICICETPKYEITFNDDEYFAINDEELEEVKEELDYEKNKSKIQIHYIKGLAELSEKAMELCLSEGYKNIKTITMRDAQEALETIELFMGSEVKPRKEYILEHYDEIKGNLE